MCDRGRNVSFKNFGFEIVSPVISDRFNEVNKMIATTAELFDLFTLLVPGQATIK